MLSGEFLVSRNLITQETLDKAVKFQLDKRIPIGTIAVQNQFITDEQLVKILRRLRSYKDTSGGTDHSKRFGDVSIELEILNEDEVSEIKRIQDSKIPLIGNVLVEMGAITSRDFVKALKDYKDLNS